MHESKTMLSRVADSLYWMSRYLERAENTARLLDVYLNIRLDVPESYEHKQMLMLQKCLGLEDIVTGSDSDALVKDLTLGRDNPASVFVNVSAARENARQVREHLSSEMWTQLNKLYLDVRYATVDGIWHHAPHDFYGQVKDGSHLFAGICDATMTHNQGWHFIQIGRYMERIQGLVQLISVHFDDTALTTHADFVMRQYFELVSVLKSVTAFEAYCKVYNANLQPGWITEFLLFNREFPRSLRFGVERILTSLTALSDVTGRSRNARLYRLAGRLQSNLSFDEIADVGDLQGYLSAVKSQIGHIHHELFDTFISYSIETAL
jgi:uncharacterized alpha-E superfamily protein